MTTTEKTLLDQNRVRLTVSDFEIRLEELPRKPVKRFLRTALFNTRHAVTVMHADAFIPANIMRAVKLDETSTFASVYAAVRAEIDRLYQAHPDMKSWGIYTDMSDRFYLQVTPEDAPHVIVHGKDFVLHVRWDNFSVYSPSSDFNQPDPYYTEIVQKSPAAARKLYKLLKEKKTELEAQSWHTLSDWLRKAGVAYDTNHSQWT